MSAGERPIVTPPEDRKQIAIAPLEADTEQTIRDACAAQGCDCGDRLRIEIRPATDEEIPEYARGAAKQSMVDVGHRDDCPFLRGAG